MTYTFHHLREYFTEDTAQRISEERFKSLFDLRVPGAQQTEAATAVAREIADRQTSDNFAGV